MDWRSDLPADVASRRAKLLADRPGLNRLWQWAFGVEAELWRKFGDEIAAGLQEREAIILFERFVRRRTLEEVGKDLGITRERVRQLENRALDRLDAVESVRATA